MDADQQQGAEEAQRIYGRVTRDATRRALALRSRYALAVLNIYATYAREDRRAWPTKETVARELGLSNTRRISEAVIALVQAGLMEPCGRARNTATVYCLPWIPEANGRSSPAVERMLPAACATPQEGGRAPNTLRQSAKRPAVERTQSDQDQIRENHTPSGSVNLAALAGQDKIQDRPPASRQEAAPPPAVECEDPTDQEEREEQEGQARRLVDAGLFTERGGLDARYQACLALVRAYRRRWPASWPCDWAMAADLPQLTGNVKDRPAWIATHLTGYSNGWMPENQDGSVRVWHAALLAGNLDAAMKAARVENGYAPERAAAAMKAKESEPPSRDLRDLMENIVAVQEAPTTSRRRKAVAPVEDALKGLLREETIRKPATEAERALQAQLDAELKAARNLIFARRVDTQTRETATRSASTRTRGLPSSTSPARGGQPPSLREPPPDLLPLVAPSSISTSTRSALRTDRQIRIPARGRERVNRGQRDRSAPHRVRPVQHQIAASADTARTYDAAHVVHESLIRAGIEDGLDEANMAGCSSKTLDIAGG